MRLLRSSQRGSGCNRERALQNQLVVENMVDLALRTVGISVAMAGMVHVSPPPVRRTLRLRKPPEVPAVSTPLEQLAVVDPDFNFTIGKSPPRRSKRSVALKGVQQLVTWQQSS